MSGGPAHAAFVAAMLAWLNERVAPAGVRIEADTALFEDGLIDSMRILELIAWTERETGRAIPDELVLMEHFRTPRRIAEVFAGVGAGGNGGSGPGAGGSRAVGRVPDGPSAEG